MLAKKYRLVTSKEILTAMRTRYQLRTQFLTLKMRHLPGNFRVVVVVSKKISKRAHHRNRTERRIHAVFERLKHKGQLPPNISLVVQVTNKAILSTDFSTLEKDLLDGVGKLYFTYRDREQKRPASKPVRKQTFSKKPAVSR